VRLTLGSLGRVLRLGPDLCDLGLRVGACPCDRSLRLALRTIHVGPHLRTRLRDG